MSTPAAYNLPDVRCPSCGATLSAEAIKCWLCNVPLDGKATMAESPKKSPPEARPVAMDSGPIVPTPAHFQFGLASLLLTMTLISVCLGAASLSPGLGIGLMILATPAFLRTAFAARRLRRHGRPMEIFEKVMAFLGSLGLVVAISVAAGVAFYATCWGGFFGGAAVGELAGARGYDPIGWGLTTGVIVGLIAGIAVAVFLLRRFWRFHEN